MRRTPCRSWAARAWRNHGAVGASGWTDQPLGAAPRTGSGGATTIKTPPRSPRNALQTVARPGGRSRIAGIASLSQHGPFA
eukprot:6094302-Lingulodinium_polyedra.AAC.1